MTVDRTIRPRPNDDSNRSGGESVDRLIRFIATLRRQDQSRELVGLIPSDSIRREDLVELASIDLIYRRRAGADARVEDYLSQFSALAESESEKLDLIDSEICVRRELGQLCDVEDFSRRFPALIGPIEELLQLDAAAGSPLTGPPRLDTESVGAEFSVDDPRVALPDAGRPGSATVADVDPATDANLGTGKEFQWIEQSLPIELPKWMSGVQTVASGPVRNERWWLLKGRDTRHNESIVIKVIPLAGTSGQSARSRILDLCEKSSLVTHPAWVAPQMAVIQNDHLAVIRPWVFGEPARDAFGRTCIAMSRPPDPDSGNLFKPMLRHFVRVAFALSAAHRSGAVHGGVHSANVIVDHESNVKVVDASSSVLGWSFAQDESDSGSSPIGGCGIASDIAGLSSMITRWMIVCRDWDRLSVLVKLLRECRRDDPDSCAKIGEMLQEAIDRESPKRRWW